MSLPLTPQHPLWLYLLTHFKEKSCFVEGPLSNLQPCMMQFSKPKKSLARALDPFRRFETPANDYLDKPGRAPAPAPSRFDAAYYRTHDTITYVPPDAQSVVSQALTQSFPLSAQPFPGAGGGKKMTYSGYASSVISQQPAESTTGSLAPGHALAPMSSRASSIAYSQYDRLPPGPAVGGGFGGLGDKKQMGLGGPRKLSIGSIAPSDAVSSYAYGYKAGDDDTQSIAPSQAGVTDF